MLDTLRKLIADFTSPVAETRHFEDNDYRLSAAALLVHVISLDGAPNEAERRKLNALLEYRFELAPDEVDELVAAATMIEGEAVDLYRFTSLINRSVDKDGRLRIVEMMWELVFADGHVSEFEENVVWRAADLLGVSSQERIEIKRRVAAGRLAPDAAT